MTKHVDQRSSAKDFSVLTDYLIKDDQKPAATQVRGNESGMPHSAVSSEPASLAVLCVELRQHRDILVTTNLCELLNHGATNDHHEHAWSADFRG